MDTRYDSQVCTAHFEPGRLQVLKDKVLKDEDGRWSTEDVSICSNCAKHAEVIEMVKSDLEFQIPKGDLWFRSRIGVKYFSTEIDGYQVFHVAEPFKSDEIGARSPQWASPGRTNRDGVSILYLASEIETAIAEIRPHPSHRVSVGGFRAIKPLRIANFNPPIGNFSSSDKRLDLFAVIFHVGELLGAPVVPEERHRYAATQLLADVLIRRGFDGLKFRSSVGIGQNICIFDPRLFEFDESNSFAKQVDSLNYQFSDISTSPPVDV